MRRGWSLRRRLLGWLLASTAALGAIALADTWREAVRTATTVSDRVLIGSALAMAERVTVGVAGGLDVDIPYSALEMLTSTAQDSVFYRIDGPRGFITGYQALPRAPLRDDLGFANEDFAGDHVRLVTLARSATTGAGAIPFTVTVAESTLARTALAREILIRSAVRLSGLILAAAAIAWLAVTQALRPVAQLEDAIAARSPQDLRPIAVGTPRELSALVAAMNGFLARAGTAIVALRNFTGNASHQLRTPLAVLRTEIALASRTGDPAALGRADAAVARAERVLAQLLILARVDAAPAPDPMDLGALAREITAEFIPEAPDRDLGYEGTGGHIRAEPVLVGEAIRNLIHNALAYGGPEITVRVDGPLLVVEDNGAGIPPDRRAALMQRFSRGGSGTGTGLGLAIVAEIAALFHATVALEEREGGGLRVSLRFPSG